MADLLHGDETVNSIAFIETADGGHIEYEGPFAFLRDGGSFEVAVAVGDSDRAVGQVAAENIVENREGELLVALRDGEVASSGIITSLLIDDGELLVRVNDGNYIDPSDLEIRDGEVTVDD